MQMSPRGIVFDKDGTLFDFEESWGQWAVALTADLAEGDAVRRARIAEALGIDLTAQRFRADSPVIAGTAEDFAKLLLPNMPGWDETRLLRELNARAAQVEQMPVTPLAPFIEGLRARNIATGVATNDAEASARAHLAAHDALEVFDFVAGYDSGFGAKPGPGMCLAFAEAIGAPPADCWMVGDSTHDLRAGRAAGMGTVAVLTGVATRQDLEPWADLVLPDITHLPEAIAG